MFALQRADWSFSAAGARRRLPSGPAETLGERVRAFFADHGADEDGSALLVGAIPFDRQGGDVLYQPDHVEAGGFPMPGEATMPSTRLVRMTAEPEPAAYMQAVSQALGRMTASSGGLRKVVLSRSLHLEFDEEINPAAIAGRLARDGSVTTFLTDVTEPRENGPRRVIVGATPELLVERRGLTVVSYPLAGSAPRFRDVGRDRLSAEGLLRSDKDRREHAIVVDMILDLLSPLCTQLAVPDGPTLKSTTTMWHLGTRIEGMLKDRDISSAALAAILHPTPAVSGQPRDASLEAIRDLESGDRGFYAGAVGWTDAQGDGQWHVILRCAEICGKEVVLNAGAGIVAGSDPAAEVAETSAKFRAMLDALDLNEAAYAEMPAPLREAI